MAQPQRTLFCVVLVAVRQSNTLPAFGLGTLRAYFLCDARTSNTRVLTATASGFQVLQLQGVDRLLLRLDKSAFALAQFPDGLDTHSRQLGEKFGQGSAAVATSDRNVCP